MAESAANPSSLRRSCLMLLVVWALLVAGVGQFLVQRGLGAWTAYAVASLGLTALVIGVAGIVLLLDQRARSLCVCLLRQLPREVERWDIAAARRTVDHPGRRTDFGPFRAWTDTPHDFEPTLERAVQGAGEHFSHLTGLPGEMSTPLRVLCFERAEDLAEYARAGGLEAAHLRGYYAGLFHKRIVVCRETSERVPNTLLGTLAHEVTHHLFRTATSHAPPPWLDEGIPEAVAARCSQRLAGPGADLRALRAARARGHLLPGRELFSLTRLRLSRYTAHWQDASDCAFVTAFYRQSGSVVTFLHRLDAAAFREFVQRLPRHGEAAWFESCFGQSPDEAVDRWLAELEETPLPAFEAPPAELRERMEQRLVRHIAHPYSPVGARLLAVHLLGATGYPWHARVLVDALADHEPLLHEHARMALEDLAGESRGRAPSDWLTWLESLPSEVVAPQTKER